VVNVVGLFYQFSQVAALAFKSNSQPISFVMRILRYILRLVFALEALGLLSLAFVTLRNSGAIVAAQRLHFGPHSILALFCFIVVLTVLSAITALRLERGDPLGRWSLLAASIFNLLLFPVGTILAAAGIFYFLSNPAIEAPLRRKQQPIAGDGATKWTGTICMIAQVVWGVAVVSSIRLWTAARGMPQVQSEGLFWITLASAIYGCLVFHELGHIVLGDVVGFRLVGFGVGPLSWAYSGERWSSHIRYDKLLGGHTAMVPTKPRNIRARVIVHTLGGPLASATLAAIGAIALLLIPGPAWPAAVGRTVALATGFALGDFLFNLLPMANESQYSDGAFLWQMLRRGPMCDFHCANHYMALSRTTSLRPRDWPTATVERAAQLSSHLSDSAGSFAFSYLHFLDRGDWQHALNYLDQARNRSQAASKLAHALTIDRAYLEAFHRREPREAQRLFEQAPPREDSPSYWRALITLQAAHGDLIRASATWNKAWDMALKRPDSGISDMDQEQLRLVGAWLEELRAQPLSA
jgi:hypothetical protein